IFASFGPEARVQHIHLQGSPVRFSRRRRTSLVLCTGGGVAPPECLVWESSQGRLFQARFRVTTPGTRGQPGTTAPAAILPAGTRGSYPASQRAFRDPGGEVVTPPRRTGRRSKLPGSTTNRECLTDYEKTANLS